jgi:monothiol glutaredoxin
MMQLNRLLTISLVSLLASFVSGFTTLSNGRIAFSQRVLQETALASSADFLEESADDSQERVKALVENHPVVLFMKGSKLFPQCGFSNTAVQILTSFGVDFHTVDVLADDGIRQGVKVYSEWPTIPQLYVCGEFVGGSDIMVEMYQNGELGEMIEKAKADMI